VHVKVVSVLKFGHDRTPLEATKEATTEINRNSEVPIWQPDERSRTRAASHLGRSNLRIPCAVRQFEPPKIRAPPGLWVTSHLSLVTNCRVPRPVRRRSRDGGTLRIRDASAPGAG
jgi:hypothetical protein